MKALSYTQPYATLSAYGLKKIETRSWPTKFRGTFAMHAAKGFPRWAQRLWLDDLFFTNGLLSTGIRELKELPRGAIIGVADLAMCLRTDQSYYFLQASHLSIIDGQARGETTIIDYRKPAEDTPEFHFGDYSEGRFMFFLENARVLPEPIPCKGALGFWTVPEDIEAQIAEQLADHYMHTNG